MSSCPEEREPLAGGGVGQGVPRSPTRLAGALAAVAVLVGAGPAAAQGDPAGFELSLTGPQVALAGRPVAVRGVAYRVFGLAELRPLPRAHVRARVATDDDDVPEAPWVDVVADARGAFQIDVPAPEAPRGETRLEVAVGDGRDERSFPFPLALNPPLGLDLIADRRLYEPGETIHLWARVWDLRSLRPMPGVTVRFANEVGRLGGGPREVRTADSGVASLDVAVPGDAIEGDHSFVAMVGGVSRSVSLRVGTRVFARLFATVHTPDEAIAPHGLAQVTVNVRTPSGAPVRGATVQLEVDGQRAGSARTGRDGTAGFEVRAPAYLEHDTGTIGVRATIQHPAHGQVVASSSIRLAVPLALDVEAVVPHGGLVPEVAGVMWLVLSDGSGEPPPAGTEVEVRGAAVRGRPERVRTDEHGIAEVPVHLPRGAATQSEDEDTAHTTLVVHVAGRLGRTVRVQVPVLRDALVVPRVAAPVLAVGRPVEVALARRPAAGQRPVIVELLADGALVVSKVVPPGESRARIDLPAGWLGVLLVRARPLVEDGVAEGAGAIDAVLVRPELPFFPGLEASRDVYGVRDRATVTLRTPAAATPRAWAAVLVRDLAAHAGESPFSFQWLDGAFEQAVIDPSTDGAARFLRTALAAHAAADPTPTPAPPLLDALGLPPEETLEDPSSERGTLRDPFPLADELRRRGVGPTMLEIEELLASSLDEDGLAEVTVGRGAARRFKPDLLESLGEPAVTIGDAPLTVAMLQAADPSFRYESVARRVGRRRLVQLAVQLAAYLDPGDDASVGQRMAAREPFDRWLPRMVERGVIEPEALLDPWGGHFVLRRGGTPALTLAVEAAGIELVSPGPDGRAGTADDLRDPFARAVPAGTPYAVASGEDELLRTLSLQSSAEEILQALLASYQRASAEVSEEEIGDAMIARASEGSLSGEALGQSYGGAGLGLTGTGRGGGGSGSGTIGLGSMGTIGHGRGSGFASAVARVVRERFPATLKFVPSIPIDPSGRTPIEVPLADAITTYRVEAVVWTADGFVWSTSINLRVDQELTVDAPVPEEATVGDRLLLPVRVANRAARERELVVRLAAPGARPTDRTVRVPAADAIEVPLTVVLDHPVEDELVVVASTASDQVLDAVRRPVAVRRPTRRVRTERSSLAGDAPDLAVDVPAGASALPGSEVRVSVGLALFPAPASEPLAAWVDAFDPAAPAGVRPIALDSADGPSAARAVGARWSLPATSSEALSAALARVTEATAEGNGAGAPEAVALLTDVLLGLAPAVPHLGTAGRPRAELEALLRAVRTRVSTGAAEVEDDPALWARVAAALALTAPRGASTSRVGELVRRARRALLEVGEDTWVAADDGLRATAWLAVAELALGERARAFRLVTTLGRLTAAGRPLDGEALAAARIAALRLSAGRAVREVRVVVDGRSRRLALARGEGRLPAPELGTPGRHAVRIEGAGRSPLFLRTTAVYGVPWSDVPRRPGSLRVELEGEPPAIDERATLAIVVRNRSPRTVVAPTLQVTLFAGAELDEEARMTLTRHGVRSIDTALGVVQMTLPALPPGALRRVPLPVNASVGGDLSGLGVAAWPSDRPEDVTIVAPRRLHLVRREAVR